MAPYKSYCQKRCFEENCKYLKFQVFRQYPFLGGICHKAELIFLESA
jgi:hypothetical protein